MVGVPGRVVRVAVLLTLVALGGCGGVGAAPAGSSSEVAAPLPDPPPAPRPQAGSLDPGPGGPPSAEYQDRLTRLDRELGGALDRMRGSRDPETLRTTTLEAASVAGSAGKQMRADPHDPGVSRANTALAEGLGRMANELVFLADRIREQRVCTGPAAVDTLATAPSMPALRAAAAGLRLAGEDGRSYRWGASLPPVPSAESVPPPLTNGALLLDRRGPTRGNGVLEVRNDGIDEVVLVLARDGAAVLSVAVRSARTATVDGLPDGDYQLVYTSGRDWDLRLGAFGRDCVFRRFTRPTPFRTRTTGTGVDYTVQTVVVRTGPADAATEDVPASALPG